MLIILIFKLKRMPKTKKRKGRKSSKQKVIKRSIALHCSTKTKKKCYDFFFTTRSTEMICAKSANLKQSSFTRIRPKAKMESRPLKYVLTKLNDQTCIKHQEKEKV
jgi:hypothetical protein